MRQQAPRITPRFGLRSPFIDGLSKRGGAPRRLIVHRARLTVRQFDRNGRESI